MIVFLYVSYILFAFSPYLLFWEFWIWSLSFYNNNNAMLAISNVYFWQIYNIHNHTRPCILMAFLNWVGNNECNVESPIMILFYASCTSLIPPYSGSLENMLWSYLIETCSNNFGTSCGSVWTSTFNFIQSLKIGDLHNLLMMHNPIIQILLYLIVDFWL